MTSSKPMGPKGAKAVREALMSSFPNQWDLMSQQYKSRTGRYFFHVIVNNELCLTGLYDPGAEASLMAKKTYLKWAGRKAFPTRLARDLTSAFGHGSQDTLLTHLPLAAMGKSHVFPVYIVPHLSCDFIAGADFIKTFKMSLDAVKQKIITDETIEVHVEVPQIPKGEGGVHPSELMPEVERRRVRLRREDFQEFGFSSRCPG